MTRWVGVFILVVLQSGTVDGWWVRGHRIVSKAAVSVLPEQVPAFFRAGGDAIAHYVWDPDLARNRGTQMLRRAEGPEHYFNPERLTDVSLPGDRIEFMMLCASQGIAPDKVGFLPYSVAEWTQRLAVAFAEHRRWPENLYIKWKCLMYAGFVAHYAQDLCQPLHVTRYFDGRPGSDGSLQSKGIHANVDDLIRRLDLKSGELARGQEPAVLDSLMDGIAAQIENSRTFIDTAYSLADRMPSVGESEWSPVPEVVAFGTERARESVRFTASLYLTAWRLSERLEFEDWVIRSESPAGE